VCNRRFAQCWPAEERGLYDRLDSAKTNIAVRSTKAEYPNGDNVQVVEPWSPSETWAGLSNDDVNSILTKIALGPGGGNHYTARTARPGAPPPGTPARRARRRSWIQNNSGPPQGPAAPPVRRSKLR